MGAYIKSPRKWQTLALNKWEGFTESRFVVQAPVASGKTWVLAQIVREWLAESIVNRVVVAAKDHTGVTQIENEIRPLVRTPIYKGESLNPDNFNNYRLVIITHPKLIRCISILQGEHVLLVFDECHHDNINAIVYHYATTKFQKVVGCSASPWSEGCLRFYQGGFTYKLSEAVKDGVVSDYELLKETDWEDTDTYAIEFTESVDEADITHETEENEKRINQWKDGDLTRLRTYNIGTEGLDNPAVSTVIIRRKTRSVILAYQMLGRGLRSLGGKKMQCVIRHKETLETMQRAIKRAG